MQIDWFTFIAQILNFLLLVWLLKRFLYGPILHAIDEREKTIAAQLQSASEREAQALTAQKSYEQSQAELAQVKETLTADAAKEANQWKQDRLSELRDEVAIARKAWHASISREQQQFLRDLRERTARQVQEVVRHVLRELADHELESQVVERFLIYLDELPRDQLTFDSSESQPGALVVRTAFSLSDDDEARLSKKIQSRIPASQTRFETAPDLICGIELVVKDHKLQWNIDNYLGSLEQFIISALNQQTSVSGAD